MDDIRLLTAIMWHILDNNQFASVPAMRDGVGWTESKTRRVLKRLLNDGIVARVGRGQYTLDWTNDTNYAYKLWIERLWGYKQDA